MKPETVTYFGYGSLVNRRTRPPDEPFLPARLRGWERVWGHRVLPASDGAGRGACCSLSIRRVADELSPVSHPNGVTQYDNSERVNEAGIDGVLVTIPVSELPLLDAREAGYDRVLLPASDFQLAAQADAHGSPGPHASEPLLPDDDVIVYVSSASQAGPSNGQFPVLQSYVDCVLAGYLNVFEQGGMQSFLDTTFGWDGVIEDDRDKPRYPRAVTVPTELLERFDQLVVNRRLRQPY